MDMRVGEILAVEDVEGADSLYKIQVDLGEEKRQVIAGIKELYEEKDLLGKKVIVVANLEEKEIFGEKSQGMILAAGKEADLLTVEKAESGSKIS